MSDLTFIGLVNYSNTATNLINVIFSSSNITPAGTSYLYQVTASNTVPAPPTPGTLGAWLPIINCPTELAANRQISAQLVSPITIGSYYVYIVSSVTKTIIWQQFTTPTYITTNTFTSIVNYTTNAIDVTTASGGYKLDTGPNTATLPITSKMIYTNAALTINLTTELTYVDTVPLFVMSSLNVIIGNGNKFKTTGGSINVFGSSIVPDTTAIVISGAVTYSGPLSLNGTATTNTGTGIRITGAVITQTGTGTLTFNGEATNGLGVLIIGNVTLPGTLLLNGTATSGTGIQIPTAVITKTGAGTLTFNAMATTGTGIRITGAVTLPATLELNGTATDGIGSEKLVETTNENTLVKPESETIVNTNMESVD